jgi:hypothetical protein
MTRSFTVIVVALAIGLAASRQAPADSLLLSDNFQTQNAINDDLGTRQTGAWAPTTWTIAGAGAYGMYNDLELAGQGAGWETALLNNDGTSLVGRKYTIAGTMDLSSAYSGRPDGITVRNDQVADIAAGAGSLFCDIDSSGAWEVLYNSGSGFVGKSGTITGKTSYAVQLQVDETGATRTAAFVVDGNTLGTIDWDPGAGTNRYIGIGYNITPAASSRGIWHDFSLTGTVSTPEPSTLMLLVTGLIGLLAYAWRKRR